MCIVAYHTFIGFEPNSIDYEPKRRLRHSIIFSGIVWLLLPLLYTIGVDLSCHNHMYVPDEAFVYGRVTSQNELAAALEQCESDIYWLIRCGYHLMILAALVATRQRFGSSAARSTYHLLTWVIAATTLLRAIVAVLLYKRFDYSLCITAAAAICNRCCDFFIIAALLYTDTRKSTHGLLIGHSLNTPLMNDGNGTSGPPSSVAALSSHSGTTSRVIVEARHVIQRQPILPPGGNNDNDNESDAQRSARMLWSAQLRVSSHDESPRAVTLRLLPRLRTKREFHSEAREFTNFLSSLPSHTNIRPGHSMLYVTHSSTPQSQVR
jgi:hypothetical protein